MNKIQLLRTLRQHIKLSEKRSTAYEQNKIAKALIYIGGAFIILYLLFIAIALALIANSSSSNTPYEIFFALAPFLLGADFSFRFIGQRTPVQLIKPYTLLPIPKYTCVELFIISSVITPNNLVWTAITIPYAIMTTLFSEGIFATIGIIISFQFLVIINSQWYMLVRTLINQNIKWWFLPIIIYAIIFSPLYLYNIETTLDIYSTVGRGLTFWNPLYYIILITILALFIKTNKHIQFYFTYKENAGIEESKLKKVSEFHMFERFGEIGEYLKLEIKGLIRNKNMRKSFVFGTIFVIILSLVISFTNLYEDNYSKTFWIVYTFVIYGTIMLIKIMSPEGNYIEGLMVHKENIIQLLKAKYYFSSSMLLLPFLLMLPTVFMEKYTLLTLFSMMCFTAGPIYCLLMQMAVYNRQTIPLNTKFISKGNIENNYFQLAAELVAMFAPVIFISLSKTLFNETLAYIILLTLGIIFIAIHNLWIKNIYMRFMKRRYLNMDGFRATR